ncbi:glycosyltransferase [Falsiroseomonas oryzae]|uniref:glycosyltransferase n=1 Tax=Falsiroseomonas oryzae TaxID=2766473 RepID=UPI0022EA1472|nr:glycosyltransferase [Roseomonas sp. MO-31]
MGSAEDPLAEAELRRDASDWSGAALAFARHLARLPEDWRVWIQHGHCVKEAGDPAGALASYRRAEAGLPEDADLQVQIGHALKLLGDLAGARAAYARALEIDPLSGIAWREVAGLLGGTAAATAPPGGLSLLGDLRVVFDLSDLWSWFGTARAPTGIQRIQMEIAGAALGHAAGLAEARLAVFRPESGTWRELPWEAFRRLAGLSRADADPFDPAWTESRAQVAALLDAASDLAFPDGAWLVNLGSSWWLPGYHLAVRTARARHGVRYAALVHDTGPVTAPEYSEPAASARFARWFAALGVQAELLLAISDATRRDMQALAPEALPGLPTAPVHVLRPDVAPRPVATATLPDLPAGPYALCVGTIEARKDHLFVLNAWLALLRRHGAAVPHLVLAGRAGFGAEPVLELLRRAPALTGRVTWLDAVPEATLAALYHGALFTICHSRHEGWGLPVTEALAHGKAVVAPAHSGLVEAGQGLALHHASGSEPEFLRLVERLILEPDFRAETEARIAAGLRLRSWRAVAEELLAALQTAPAAPPTVPAPPLGVVHRLGLIDSPWPEPAMAWADLLRAGPGWGAPEPWGCPTAAGTALIRLPLPGGTRGALRLYLALRGMDGPRRVALRAGRAQRLELDVPAGERPVAVLEITAPGAQAEVAINAVDGVGRPAGIGVVALMACAPDDLAARLTFLETVSFVWPERASPLSGRVAPPTSP